MKYIKTILKIMVKSAIVICLLIFFSCNASDDLLVSYSVTSSGTGTKADITYTINNKTVTLTGQALPWEYKFKLFTTSEDCFYLELTGKKTASDTTTLTLAISYEDKERFVESFSDDVIHTINATPCLEGIE